MAYTRLDIYHSESSLSNMGWFGSLSVYDPRKVCHAFGRLFKAMAGGALRGKSFVVSQNSVKATGTVTFSSFVADDTVTINGQVFTGKASPSGTNQWAIGSDDTDCATNFAAKINASALAGIVNVVTATSALGVVTLTCSVPGVIGNLCSLAISAHGSVSAANLASGSEGSQISVDRL